MRPERTCLWPAAWPRHPHFGGPGTPECPALVLWGQSVSRPAAPRGLVPGQRPAHGTGRPSRGGGGAGVALRDPFSAARRSSAEQTAVLPWPGRLGCGTESPPCGRGRHGICYGAGPAGRLGGRRGPAARPAPPQSLSSHSRPAGECWAEPSGSPLTSPQLTARPSPASTDGGQRVALAGSGLLGARPWKQLLPGPPVRPGRPAASQLSSWLSAWGGAGPPGGQAEGGGMGHVPAEHKDPSPKGRARLRLEATTCMRSASSVQSREKSV